MVECPQCHFENQAPIKFCGGCGQPLFPGEDLFVLEKMNPEGQEERVVLAKPLFIIGRSPECDLIIPHNSISRRHAQITQTGGDVRIEDLGSKNGVTVNGRLLASPELIQPGDEVQFGEVAYVFDRSTSPVGKRSRPRAADKTQLSRLEMLLELSKLINSSLVVSDVLERVMDAVMQITRAQRGLLMIANDHGELEFKVARNFDEASLRSGQYEISMSSVRKAYRTGKPFISVDADTDSRISAQESIINLGLKTVMGVPLKSRQQTRGVIYVDSMNVTHGFSDGDLQMLESLADHAGIAVENAELMEENKELFFDTVQALAEAIEKRDPSTGGHTKRVVELSLAIGRELKLDAAELENIKMASLLHDIGKIGVDDQVLRKQGALTEAEFEMIRKHPEIGRDIIKPIHRLEGAVSGILLHHERFDGTGYPFGYDGTQIPMLARIVAVADAYDAMVSDRPYRKGLSKAEALAELLRNRGEQFDAAVVDALLASFQRVGDETIVINVRPK